MLASPQKSPQAEATRSLRTGKLLNDEAKCRGRSPVKCALIKFYSVVFAQGVYGKAYRGVAWK